MQNVYLEAEGKQNMRQNHINGFSENCLLFNQRYDRVMGQSRNILTPPKYVVHLVTLHAYCRWDSSLTESKVKRNKC